MIQGNLKKIKEVLTRNVVQILPDKKRLENLMKKKRLRVYFGIDPTGPRLHLGHAVSLRKLKEFQDLGHETIFLIGDFTAKIGDPSERLQKRKPLSETEIKKNMKNYLKEVGKILDLSKLKVKQNSEWLSKLNLENFLKIASKITVSRLLERDMFQERIAKKREIWLSELLYPLFQAYDSLFLNVDLEIGATDQTFNMLLGREFQKIFEKKEKFILTTPILLGRDGRKMSKTYKNTINLSDPPQEMYGKIMSLRDELVLDYFRLCTNLSLNEIKKIEQKFLSKKVNPKKIKAKLAKEIVALYYGKKIAQKTAQEFERVFKEKKLPSKIKKIKISEKKISLAELLVKAKIVPSKSEAKRLILQGGVKINQKKEKDWKKIIEIKRGKILQVGKRRFFKLWI